MAQHKETEIPYQSTYIPFLKITPSYICGYYRYEGEKRKPWQSKIFTGLSYLQDLVDEERPKEVYTGEITAGSRKRLKTCCELLHAISKVKKVVSPKTGIPFSFRINFITLTLSAPQGHHTDKELKEVLLAPFLRHFKTKGLKNYIWKAERQWNGNVHFHIFSDCFLDRQEITDYWNRLQSKLGYIEDFYQKHGHRNPPSTNVKSVITQESMTKYMLKYMLKNEEEEKKQALKDQIPVESIGKVWDCSINLKLKNDTADVMEDWHFELINKKTDSGLLVEITTDHCRIFVPRKHPMSKVAPNFLLQRLKAYLQKVRTYEKPAKD